jgi:hypothetical protein
MVLREYNRRFQDGSVLARLDAAFEKPRAAQERTLKEILAAHADTAYGRDHGFDRIRDARGYREHVPVVDYEGLRPYVDRMLTGEADVLVRGRASYFSTTSGSTAAPKFIPGTQSTITTGCDATLARNAFLRRDHPEVFAGRPLLVVGSMSEGTTTGGATYGAMTGFGYLAAHMGFAAPPFPYDLFTIRDSGARNYAILRTALAARDVTALVSYNPSTLLRLAESARAAWDELVDDIARGTLSDRLEIPAETRATLAPWLGADPGRADELRGLGGEGAQAWWPSLSLLMCWRGGAAGFYLDDLKAALGALPVRELGLVASEAAVSVAVDEGRGGAVLTGSGFFEFVPDGEPDSAARPLWDLDLSGRYRVLVTTMGGLYRYDLGDVVRVIGYYKETPQVEFLHRAGRVYSFTGEKLTEYQVTVAVRSAAEACDLRLAGFTAVPVWGRPPRYEVFVEPVAGAPAATWERLGTFIDDALAGVNIEYEGKRSSGRLGPILVTTVPRGSFAEVRRRHAGPDAQYKEVHLAPDPDYRLQLGQAA